MAHHSTIPTEQLGCVYGGNWKGTVAKEAGELLQKGWAWVSKSRAPVNGPPNGVHLNETTGAVTTYTENGLRKRQYEYGHAKWHDGETGAGMHYHDFDPVPNGRRGPGIANE